MDQPCTRRENRGPGSYLLDVYSALHHINERAGNISKWYTLCHRDPGDAIMRNYIIKDMKAACCIMDGEGSTSRIVSSLRSSQ